MASQSMTNASPIPAKPMVQATYLQRIIYVSNANIQMETSPSLMSLNSENGAVRITKRSRKIPTLLIFRPRPPPTRHSLQRESNEVWVC